MRCFLYPANIAFLSEATRPFHVSVLACLHGDVIDGPFPSLLARLRKTCDVDQALMLEPISHALRREQYVCFMR